MIPIGITLRYYTCKILMPILLRIKDRIAISDNEWNEINSQWLWVQQEWKTRND
jgi:hypothetical protein